MLRVAATSQRHDHVTRQIHKLHAMQPIVIAMSTARAIGVALERKYGQQIVGHYSGGASCLGISWDSLVGRAARVVSLTAVTVTGADSM